MKLFWAFHWDFSNRRSIREEYRPHVLQNKWTTNVADLLFEANYLINLLAPKLFFLILAHPVYKMWITQEPNKLELWNKQHFEEQKTESTYHV